VTKVQELTAANTERLKAIRAIWVVAHATSAPTEQTAGEFYYAVGDLLEGVPLDKVLTNLRRISATEVYEELNDMT